MMISESQKRIKQLDEQMQRRTDALRHKDEGIKTLQVTLDSYREKCKMMEQEVEQHQGDMKALRDDIEKRESFLLAGGVAGSGLAIMNSVPTNAGNKSFENNFKNALTSEGTLVSIKIENE